MGEVEEEPFDKEVWEGIIAELNQMEEDGTVTPDPDAPEFDMSAYDKWTDEEIEPYAAEAAAKLRADIKLRARAAEAVARNRRTQTKEASADLSLTYRQ